MIDFDILEEHYGTTELKLRAIFQAPPEGDKMVGDVKQAYKADLERHKRTFGDREFTDRDELKFRTRWQAKLSESRHAFETRIQSRIQEGRMRNFVNYRWHYAADLAWDGPVFKEQVPLMLYAQGKIDIEKAASKLESAVGPDRAKQYIEKDDQGTIQSVNVTKLGESVINLVRPYITRRKAALSNKFNDLYPFLKYEPRAKTMTDKIRSEVTSQRIEIITDMQGYRHDFTQWVHKMLLHSGQWIFVAHPWVKEQSVRKVGDTVENYTIKEGPRLAHPHPTRTFYDIAHAPSTINNDNGVTYCGYWDILRYRDVRDNPGYFNASKIRYSSSLDTSFSSYRDYFEAYYSEEKVIKFAPSRGKDDSLNSMRNDRKALSGILNYDDGDCSIYFTHIYERIIPKEVGLGSYPHPLWVKLTMVNDKTCVRCRLMPSRPAFYMGGNEDDSRFINASMAHEIMPYQDQAQSLLSQMYYLMRMESLMLCAIDVDLIPDKKMRADVKDYLAGRKTRQNAMYFEWSGNKIRESLKTNPENPIKFLTTSLQAQISTCLEGIGKTLELLERNLMMSPQELGQFVQRETSATENMIVEKTTNALYSFISQGPDEARAALKVILYESLMAMGEDDLATPVTSSFPRRLIEKAGFKFYGDEGEEESEEREPDARVVLASKQHMAHAYIYNSRDGTERTVSIEAAKTLYQFVNQILANETVLRLFGWKQISGMIGEVFRLSGSIYSIQLPEELPEGGPAEGGPEQQQLVEQVQQQFAQLTEAMTARFEQSEQATAKNAEQIEQLTQSLSDAISRMAA